MSAVFPARFYGDPADVIDEWRQLRARAERQQNNKAAIERNNKSRRIQALVKQAMEGMMK